MPASATQNSEPNARSSDTGSLLPPTAPDISTGGMAAEGRGAPSVTPYNASLENPTSVEVPPRRRGSLFAVVGVLAVALLIGLSAVAIRVSRTAASTSPLPDPGPPATTTVTGTPPIASVVTAVPLVTPSASATISAARPLTTTAPTSHPTTKPTTKPTGSVKHVKPKGTDVVIQ
ncbi:MAG TPA: hypothetical protein VF316_18795, partial [Polyangiaceae bacterium]